METKPADMKPVGWVAEIGGAAQLRVIIVAHTYDPHALGGWGYLLRWEDHPDDSDPFVWPHNEANGMVDLHPLKYLAEQAE